MTLGEEHGHRTEKRLHRPTADLVALTVYESEIIKHVIFVIIFICVTLNEGQGQYN